MSSIHLAFTMVFTHLALEFNSHAPSWAYFSSTLLKVFQSFIRTQKSVHVCATAAEIEHKREVTSSLHHGFKD
jgi:hypothetical protein